MAALALCVVAATMLSPAEGIRRHQRRHRRDPDPVGEERVQEQNKYKPKFEDCETYDPTVEEGSRKGKDLRCVGILWVCAVDSFKVLLRVTQPRGSLFCCATT